MQMPCSKDCINEIILSILSINETRLDESILNEEVNIPGYDLFRNGRSRSGGGVDIYTRSILNVIERTQFVPKSVEAVCIEITKPKAKPILLTTVYRPPNSKVDFMDLFENYLNQLHGQEKELIITGDLNCYLVSTQILSSHSRRLLDILQLFQFKQLITSPTCIASSTEALLDIIATNRPEKVLGSGVIHLGINDYSLVYSCLTFS